MTVSAGRLSEVLREYQEKAKGKIKKAKVRARNGAAPSTTEMNAALLSP
jgi:hypothetical protein